LESYPDNKLIPEALFHLGLCHEREGQDKLSSEYFKELLNNYPQSAYGKQAKGKKIK
jgi:TolA-binding protein